MNKNTSTYYVVVKYSRSEPRRAGRDRVMGASEIDLRACANTGWLGSWVHCADSSAYVVHAAAEKFSDFS